MLNEMPNTFNPEQFAAILAKQLAPGVLESLQKENQYQQYQDNPVGFGMDILNEIYTDEVKALMNSVRDYPVTIAISSNAVGKTHSAASIACWWFTCFPDSQVYTAAAPPESNLKKLLWGEIGSRIEQHPDLFSSFTKTTLHVQRSAQSFLTGVTIPSSGTDAQREAKFSGKHAPYLLFILDEGDAIPDDVYRGIESCMTGGLARLLVMFNPRSEIGEAYRIQRDNRANVVHLSAFNHPNVITGTDQIPGAVTRETTVRRVNEWCRPLVSEQETPDGECFLLPEFLIGSTAKKQNGMLYSPLKPGYYKIMEPAFSYMVLGQYPSQSTQQLISRDWVEKAKLRWQVYVSEHGEIPPDVTGVVGQDVAEYGIDANVACFRYGGYVPTLLTWQGVDVISTADRSVWETKGQNISRINVDATGVGAGVAPHMQRAGCPAIAVKVAEKATEETELGKFYILRDQLWWAVREWLRSDSSAMLPPDEALCEELLVPTYTVENGKIRVMQKKVIKELLKRSPDRADALALTFYSGGFFSGCDLA